MEFSRPEYYSGWLFPSPGHLPNPGIKPGSPTLQADSLPAEPPGKPKNSEVGSLSLLQWIFPIQELNRGLLHRRWTLYQLSYLSAILGVHWLVATSLFMWSSSLCPSVSSPPLIKILVTGLRAPQIKDDLKMLN